MFINNYRADLDHPGDLKNVSHEREISGDQSAFAVGRPAVSRMHPLGSMTPGCQPTAIYSHIMPAITVSSLKMTRSMDGGVFIHDRHFVFENPSTKIAPPDCSVAVKTLCASIAFASTRQ